MTFYGQVVFSDTCMTFPKSFPHGYTGMVIFCDAFSGERDLYFHIKPHDPDEVASALKEYSRKNKHRLRDGKIWTWKPDNGGKFKADIIDGIGGIAREIVQRREYSVPNVKNVILRQSAHGVLFSEELEHAMPTLKLRTACGHGPRDTAL